MENQMITFYAWLLNDPDHPEHGEFMNDANGDELRFASQEAAMAFMTDEVIEQCTKDGIDPDTMVLVAYELEMH
jgi:hypothetical protein